MARISFTPALEDRKRSGSSNIRSSDIFGVQDDELGEKSTQDTPLQNRSHTMRNMLELNLAEGQHYEEQMTMLIDELDSTNQKLNASLQQIQDLESKLSALENLSSDLKTQLQSSGLENDDMKKVIMKLTETTQSLESKIKQEIDKYAAECEEWYAKEDKMSNELLSLEEQLNECQTVSRANGENLSFLHSMSIDSQ